MNIDISNKVNLKNGYHYYIQPNKEVILFQNENYITKFLSENDLVNFILSME